MSRVNDDEVANCSRCSGLLIHSSPQNIVAKLVKRRMESADMFREIFVKRMLTLIKRDVSRAIREAQLSLSHDDQSAVERCLLSHVTEVLWKAMDQSARRFGALQPFDQVMENARIDLKNVQLRRVVLAVEPKGFGSGTCRQQALQSVQNTNQTEFLQLG